MTYEFFKDFKSMNLKQRVYHAITGTRHGLNSSGHFYVNTKSAKKGGYTHEDFMRMFKERNRDEKINLCQWILHEITKEKEQPCDLTRQEAIEVIDAVENKEDFTYATACYDSLADKTNE